MHTHGFPPPPPPPAPIPPRRQFPRPLLAAAAGIAALSIGVALLPDSDRGTAPNSTLEDAGGDPAGSDSPVGTEPRPAPPTAEAPADPLAEWVNDYGTDSVVVMGVIQSLAGDVSDAAGSGDAVALFATCVEGDEYLTGIALDPVSLDPNTPPEWTRAITLWQRSFAACSEGDLDLAVDLVQQGTDAINELTALLEGITP